MVGDMTENEQLGKLAEESLRRKERLMHLKEKACKESNKRINDEGITKPVFRSYKPQNEITPCQIIPKMAAGDIEEVVGNQLDLLNHTIAIDEIDIANLAPRKPDWDLKRDVSKKLSILDRRTQKAIAELIRERLKTNQESHDIFQVVNVATSQASENKL